MSDADAEKPPTPSRVDVVVVSYNQRERLMDCLESVRAVGPRANLIVVDNASSDGSAEAVEERFPDAVLLALAKNAGFATAVNLGAKIGSAPYILLLNNDARLRPEALDQLEAALQEEDVAAAGPRLLGENGQVELSVDRTLAPWNEARFRLLEAFYRDGRGLARRWVERSYDRSRHVRSLSGACILLKREAFKDVRGFDERFFLYAEDVDMCCRLRDAGWRLLYVPSAAVEHHRGASSATQPMAVALAYRRSQLLFYEKHHGALAAGALRLYLALRFSLKSILGGADSRRLGKRLLRWTLRDAGQLR